MNKHRQRMSLRFAALLIALVSLLPTSALFAQSENETPRAEIINDEGGPVAITGDVNYTNAFFTLGVAAPMVILEDQAGFIARDKGFLMPPESQTLGQITSDFYESPFSYSIALPIEPQGTLRDVDQDGEEDQGVMTFAVAYWTNTFGDPFLEKRDLMGGGWSTAYASTAVSDDPTTKDEVVGGKLLVYAPDDQQGFPSGFGDDGLLFTEDDPIVLLPQGYTIVDLDTAPFTFDRSRRVEIDLIEPESAALDDFSELSYTEAFDAMIEKMRKEYAFTEYKNIDWDAKIEEFRPAFEEAEANGDAHAYLKALRDFAWSIPDGHVSGPNLIEDFQLATAGGLGMAIRDVDDGRTIVNFITPDGPADEAGIEVGAEIIDVNGTPIDDAVDAAVAWSAPFSSEHFARLQKLRYVFRAPLGTEFEVTYQNPGDDEPTIVMLTTVPERASFNFSSFNVGRTGFELPVEYEILEDSGYAYAKIYSFADNDLLSVQLWERMMQALNGADVPGLIIDMRQNNGGNGFLANQMAAYFFDEEIPVGNTGYYNKKSEQFEFDERTTRMLYPPDEDLRYRGDVAVLVGPNCNSACEFFTYAMTRLGRAAIVGQYPTAGLGGSVDQFKMPENEFFQFTIGRGVDENGEIHIEGKGVAPTVDVPVTEETLLGEGDPVLDAAIAWLNGETQVEIVDGGPIAIGESVDGDMVPGARVLYTLEVKEGDVINILLGDEAGELDTVLRLYDSEGNLVLENDDVEGGDTPNSAMTDLEIPADLTLLVEVATFDDALEGAYTLTVEAAE